MANVVVVGSQWGDEGKGKIVDWLSEQADIVVRFQGGHNAGHTLVIDGVTYKLSLLPSGRGAARASCRSSAMASCSIRARCSRRSTGSPAQGVSVTPDSLRIAENATLILPLHQQLDVARETCQCGNTHRHHRARHRSGLRGQGRPARHPPDGSCRSAGARRQDRPPAVPPQCAAARARPRAARGGPRSRTSWRAWRRACCPTWIRCGRCSTRSAARASESCSRARRARCSTSTTAPIRYVTSSNTVAAQAATGSGLGPSAIDYVLGICKAYTTRVGEGPFPTEQKNEIGRLIGERGHEFGTVTGRPRRCGWFDAVLVRQTVRTSGINGLGVDQARYPGWLDRDQGLRRAIGSTVAKSTIFRPASMPRPGSSRSTRRSRVGRARPPGHAPGRSCRRRPLNMCAGLRSWWAVRSRFCRLVPEREDTILVHNPFEN